MASVTGISATPQIERALRHASVATGTDFDYLLRTAQRESGLRPQAKSNTSSATGLFQFIEQTWFETVKQAGHQFGLGDYANAITRRSDGRYNVADQELRQEILALRRDPETASLMAGVYTRDSGNTLQSALGRAPKVGELYVAHFLGSDGAVRLISAAEATPDVEARELFPRAARANRPIFYDRDGSARTVAEVYENLMAKHGTEVARFDGVQPAPDTVPAPAGDPAGPRLVLASHFVQAPGASSPASPPTAASFFDTVRIEPAASPARPTGGPLNIIPEAVRTGSYDDNAHGKLGAISRHYTGPGVSRITGARPLGLLQRFAPLYELFRTT